MNVQLTAHLKSGKSKTFSLPAEAATPLAVDFADWLSGAEVDATMIDCADRRGNRSIIPFSSIEFLEIEAG